MNCVSQYSKHVANGYIHNVATYEVLIVYRYFRVNYELHPQIFKVLCTQASYQQDLVKYYNVHLVVTAV